MKLYLIKRIQILKQKLNLNLLTKLFHVKLHFLFFIILMFSACNDILVEEPKEIATVTFYQTADEIESAVYGIYSPLRDGNLFGGRYQSVLDAEIDYSRGRGSYSSLSEFQGLDATNIGRAGMFWTYFYQSIRNANSVIKNAPNATSVDEGTLNALTSEAKFLRAFCYFHLVRHWGAIPLRTEENMLDQDLPRTSANDVYALILSDLQFAETYLPENAKVAGRATKWAAKTLLADVYLQLEEWGNARTRSLEVINSGKHSLVEVISSDDFYKIFGPDVINTSEEIFYLKFNRTSISTTPYYAHTSSTHWNNYAGWGVHYCDSVTTTVIRDWDYKDLRKSFNLYNQDLGVGSASTMLFKKFIDPERPGWGNNVDWPIYRYADVLLLYAEADCRANGGPTSDGMEKLNMIHRRGYGRNPNAASDVDFNLSDYTKDSFVDLVIKERMYETIYEAKRYLDLKRANKIKSAIKIAYGIDVADKHLLWPIPISEFGYNDAINPETDQNPGY